MRFNNNFDNNAPKMQQPHQHQQGQSSPPQSQPPMTNGNNMMFGPTNQDVRTNKTI